MNARFLPGWKDKLHSQQWWFTDKFQKFLFEKKPWHLDMNIYYNVIYLLFMNSYMLYIIYATLCYSNIYYDIIRLLVFYSLNILNILFHELCLGLLAVYYENHTQQSIAYLLFLNWMGLSSCIRPPPQFTEPSTTWHNYPVHFTHSKCHAQLSWTTTTGKSSQSCQFQCGWKNF